MTHWSHSYRLTFCLCATYLAACNAPDTPHDDSEDVSHSGVQHDAHWGYGPDNGPNSWADLHPDYALCRDGQAQSPIDIQNPSPVELPNLTVEYVTAAVRIIRHEHVVDVIDNGHTIQVNYDEGSVLSVGDESFELAQYHFHAPSEHTVDGRHSAMEMHLVHQAESGELAVLGVLIEEGMHNPAFDVVWAELPDEVGEEIHLEHVTVNVDDLLPTDRSTFRYQGSLTTPPCSEGVSWLVMVDPIELSAEQIGQFTAIFPGNNRPTQVLGERTVLVDKIRDF